MKLTQQFLFVVLFLLTVSVNVFAKDFIHQLDNQRIIFHIDDKGTAGTIYHLDKFQSERIIAEGRITALTVSTNNPNIAQSVITEKTSQGDIVIKQDFGNPVAMAVIDGKYIIISPDGTIYPLPFMKGKGTESWSAEWHVKELFLKSGEGYYTLLKSSTSTLGAGKTTFAVIRLRDGAYGHRTFVSATGQQQPSFANYEAVMTDLKKVTLVNKDTGEHLKDNKDQYVEFIPLNGLEQLTDNDRLGLPVDHRLSDGAVQKQAQVKQDSDSQRKFLESRIIGQPEAIDLLLRIERKQAFFGGARTVPEKIYLMGLPGT